MKRRNTTWIGLLAVAVLAMPVALEAQAPAPTAEAVAGAWEGLSRGTNGELPVKVDLKYVNGAFAGVVGTPWMVVSITGGSLQGDTLTLSLEVEGTSGTLTARLQDGTLAGSWQVGAETGTVVLSRPAVPAGDPVTGEWDGEAMVQGQPMPISLSLKLSGETVTGEITSAMGRTPLVAGSWKDGTLTIAFPYVGGEPVTMVGKVQDGKLAGVFDYNSGEAQGTWAAARK